MELVREGGQGYLIAKADIQDAFRLIPMRPQHYPLLGFTWHGQFFHYQVLPMVSSTSYKTFERFSRALQWILQYHFEVSGVTHLLDDFIFIGPAGKSTCRNSLCSFKQLSQQLGIPLNWGKGVNLLPAKLSMASRLVPANWNSGCQQTKWQRPLC